MGVVAWALESFALGILALDYGIWFHGLRNMCDGKGVGKMNQLKLVYGIEIITLYIEEVWFHSKVT
jgi:hypothetical protein